jgi:DNA-binding response OmpR family regulator
MSSWQHSCATHCGFVSSLKGSAVGLPKILIVDDDQESLDLLSEFLGANGYAVDTVQDGAEAWHALTDGGDAYGIVIADLRMPGQTGFDLLRKIRKANSKQNIILMSSFISASERELAENLGAQGLLEKPFQLAELLRVVGDLVSGNAIGISS